MNQERAQERGKRALSKEAAKRDKEVFEREMKRLQVEENMQRIQMAAAETSGGIADHPGAPATVMQERKERERQEKMMQMFEEEVIVVQKKKRPPQGKVQEKEPG